MMSKKSTASLSFAFLLVAASLPALASKALELGTEQLTKGADLVARGAVRGSETVVSKDGRRLFTLVRIQVEERWKGEAPEEVIVRVPGGERDGLRQVVQGMPVFEPGEEVVVFLRPEPGPAGAHAVVGMAQGKYRVVRDAQLGQVVVRDLSGLELVPPPDVSRHVAPLVQGPLTVEALRQEVLAAGQRPSPAPAQPREVP